MAAVHRCAAVAVFCGGCARVRGCGVFRLRCTDARVRSFSVAAVHGCAAVAERGLRLWRVAAPVSVAGGDGAVEPTG